MAKAKDKNQDMLTLALATLIVVLGFYFLLLKTKTNNTQQVVQIPAIESKSGLDSVSKELDAANLTSIDSELVKLNTDSNF